MQVRTNLDMDVLRTFVTGFELGSFARAASRLGRSPSAVSTQLRKLEEQVGERLVNKVGRGLALPPAGESLLSYARRILDLNDEALSNVRGAEVEGWVRLGLPQDFAESWLPGVLARFARAHPRVRVEVRVERNVLLVERTIKGQLDLALAWGDGLDAPHAERVAEAPFAWIGRPDWPGVGALGSDPLPLVAFEPPCVFRDPAVAGLDEAGIAWRLVFTSPSLAGLWAATGAGLGVTVRTIIGMPDSLTALDPKTSGLPALRPMPLSVHRAESEPGEAVRRLKAILLDRIRSDDAVQSAQPASVEA